jgi:hypothetical protein
MPPRTVAVVCAVSLTVGWLLASILTPPVARLQSLPERRAEATPTPIDSASAYAEQLALKQRAVPAPPQPRRNPFVFGARESRAVSPGRPVRSEAQLPPPQPVGPPYRLSGIGFSETAEGVVRTAVVSDGTTVHLLKAGDTLSSYTVAEVTDTTVVLADATGARFVIRLR